MGWSAIVETDFGDRYTLIQPEGVIGGKALLSFLAIVDSKCNHGHDADGALAKFSCAELPFRNKKSFQNTCQEQLCVDSGNYYCATRACICRIHSRLKYHLATRACGFPRVVAFIACGGVDIGSDGNI